MVEVVIATAITAALGGAGAVLGVTTWAAVAFSVATTAVLGGVSYLMQQNNKVTGTALATQDPVASPINGSRSIPVAQPIPPRRYVYGQCKVGGALAYFENDNPYLYIMTLLSDGVIEAVDNVYFGETLVPVDGSGDAVDGTLYFDRLKVEYGLGETTQTASTILTAAFPDTLTSDFRQRGVARAVARLHWGADATEHNSVWGDGIQPSYAVRGVKVYDPRDVAQDINDETTWEYSDNPALCVAHALTHAWGVALSWDDIDLDALETAADVCDETLTYNGDVLPIFTLAGIFQADTDLGAQISDMLTSFRGRITFQNGKYAIVADEARDSVWTITDDDILEFGEFKHAAAIDEVYGAISAGFYDAAQGGLRETTTVYEEEAGQRETNIMLAFTARSHSAQIIAYRELLQMRDGRGVVLRLIDAACYLAAGERVTIASTAAPFMNGEYEVLQVDPETPGVRVSLRGYVEDAYVDPTEYLV